MIERWAGSVLVIFLLLGLGFGTWLSRLPAVRDHLGATTLEMSFYGLCLAAGSVIGLLVSGHSVQWLGPRRTLGITIALQALSLPGAIAIILSGQTALGLALLFLYGFVFSTGDVAMNVSGANAERALGLPRMPLMHAGYSTGTVLAMLLGALAEALGIPVQWHVVAVFAVIAAALLIVLPRLPRDEQSVRSAAEAARDPFDTTGPIPVIDTAAGIEPAFTLATGAIPVVASEPRPEDQAAEEPGRPEYPQPAPVSAGAAGTAPRGYSPWRDPRILLIGGIALATGILEGTASDWLPLALVDGQALSNQAGTVMLGVFFASVMAVRIAGSWALRRFGRVGALRGGAVLATVGVLTVILAPGGAVGTVLVVLGTVAWGLGAGLGWPIAITAAADRTETAVRDVAAVSALGYGSMLLGPMAFGFLGEHIGLLTAFWALLIFSVLSAVIAGAARETRGRA